jgi:hypothetical protein
MKMQINPINNWSAKGLITATIMSAMLCGIGANASNKPTVASSTAVKVEMKSAKNIESLENSFAETVNKYNAFEFVQADMALETEGSTNSAEEINIVSIEAEQYHAEEFAQADIAVEIDNWMYSDAENENNTIEKYNAEEFVQDEMAHEINSWMNNNCL